MKNKSGSLRHIKRGQIPVFWPISKKKYTWTIKSSPGPHAISRSIPLGILIRNIFSLAKTLREARKIISEGHIKVDGKVRKSYKYPVGLMDIIEIVDTHEFYRLIPHPLKFLYPIKISEKEADIKPCRIEKKSLVKGSLIQLHLHDGRNQLVTKDNDIESKFSTFDTILLKIPNQEIVDHLKIKKGSLAIIINGENVGRVGKIISIISSFKKRKSTITLEDIANKSSFRTILEYTFVIGKDSSPVINLGGI